MIGVVNAHNKREQPLTNTNYAILMELLAQKKATPKINIEGFAYNENAVFIWYIS